MSNQSIFEVVLAKSNIIDVVSKYVEVAQKGKNYWAICPFHSDTTPSMSISEEKQIYKCFACGVGGNSIKFIKDIDSVSNIEALKKVAAICNVDVDINISNAQQGNKYDENQLKLIEINNKAKDFYSLMLKSQQGKEALDYLTQRNLDNQIIEEFGIGFAPKNNKLLKLIQSFNYQDLELADCGLFSLNNEKFYDFFTNRIVFPILDNDGNTVGFSGRIFNKDDTRAKYTNSPESKIFIKNKILYNIANAKENLVHNNEIIVVEGFMDVIALYKAGIKNVVATMGTAFSLNHINLLKAHTNVINIFMDSDQAGQKSAFKMVSDLVAAGFEVKIVKPIENMDVDDIYLKYGKDKLKELVISSQKVFQYLIDNVINKIEANNIKDVAEFKKFVEPLIKNYKNKEEVNIFRNILKTKLNIEIEKEVYYSQNQQINSVNKSEDKIKTSDKWERKLLANMIKNKDAAEQYKIKSIYLNNQIRRHIADYIVGFYKQNKNFDVEQFKNIIKNKAELLSEFKIIEKHSLEITYHKKEFEDLINVIKNKMLNDLQRKAIDFKINKSDNLEEKVELLQKKHEVKKWGKINDKKI